MGVGVVTSGLGLLLTVWNYSRVAAIATVLEIGVLYLAISGLSLLREEPDWRR
jgi:hypothetical protein